MSLNKVLLRTFSDDVKDKLINLGFNCNTEIIDNHNLYSFLVDDEVIKTIGSHFSDNDFFFEKSLRF